MKRSEMVENIASEIVKFECGINFDEAQDLAEIIIDAVTNSGLLPPGVAIGSYSYKNEWELEESWGNDEKI